MNKMLKLIGVITIITVIGFSTASCSDGGGSSAAPDAPLAVIGVTPGSSGAAISGNVVIVFNKTMDVTVNGTVQLNSLTALSGGTWATSKNMYSIPYSDLARNTEYTVNISGFKDEAGNVMTANSDNKFTTVFIKAGLYAKTTDQITGNDNPIVAYDKTSATTAATTYSAAIIYAKNNPKEYTLLLDGDASIAGGTAASADATMLDVDGLTLRLEGIGSNSNISLTSSGRLFTVALNSKLVLGANITLNGIPSNNQPVVYINVGGRLDMYKGAVITGNDAGVSNCGGVAVYEGTFTMEGGSITGNKGFTGGGVEVISGTFTMLGGEISGNEAGNGGGVSVNGTFNLLGGSITGNTANGPNDDATHKDGGGGVCVSSNGRFNMTGGSITGNTANLYGGGVKMFAPSSAGISQYFMMFRGTISGNTAKKASSGGGVYLYGSTNFTLLSPATKANVSGNFSPAGTANQVATPEEGEDGHGSISGSDSGNAGW